MRRFFGIIFGLAFLAAVGFAALNYQYVIDYVVVSQYKPTAAAATLENQIQLTDRGNFLFRATQTQLNDSQSFNQHCEKKDEQSIVLGCYLGPQQTYIYDVQDPRLEGVKQVTAAHEMLHAVYDRLSSSERTRVNKLIEAALPAVLQTKTDLATRLQIYAKTEPGERDNELHSILGTEAASLPSELETYYAQYFKNRQIITSFAASYSKVFNDIKANQDTLLAELKDLNSEIDSLSSQYNAEAEQLKNDINSFNVRADQPNSFSSQSAFNAARADLASRLAQLESDRETINGKVSLYNQKRTELEGLNVQVDELNSKLDSTKLPSL